VNFEEWYVTQRDLTSTESEVAELIVRALELDIRPSEIDPDAALFDEGLGLDSIDALVISLEISKRYDIQIRAEDEQTHRIFSSLGALSSYVAQHAQK
jgi:acyl carrier protein